ncbi:MAG: SWIM zinc finger family protein [Synechocystis sp.]
MAKANFSRTWWGQKFIGALEPLMDSGRLSRGRSYARGDKVKKFEIKDGSIVAKVRGSVNPYFGVYKEPLYNTTIEFEPISAANWSAAIALIASKASLISRLLLNEMPENIEASFKQLGLHLLPASRSDFKTQCSCPDWSNPCKHIAGVYYLIAEQLDSDPFLLFELRGLSREKLQQELAKSPLGQALCGEMLLEMAPPAPVDSYFARPIALDVNACPDLHHFWQGSKRLPQTLDPLPQVPVAGIPLKKQGDFPPFWPRDNSFLEVMETLYDAVKTKGCL